MKKLNYGIVILLFPVLFSVSNTVKGQANFSGFSNLYRYWGDNAKRSDLITSITYDSVDNTLFFPMTSLKYYPMPYQTLTVFYKTDIWGNNIKTKVDSISGYNINYNEVTLSANGEYLFWSGWKNKITVDSFATIVLTKTDKDLNVIWEKTYPTIVLSGINVSLIENPKNGELNILGMRYTSSGSNLPQQSNKIYFIKLDSLGNVLSQQTPGSGDYDNGECMVKADDGNFFITGKTWGWGANSLGSVFSMKIDTSGNELWHHLYATNYYACWLFSNLNVGNNQFVNAGSVVPIHQTTPYSFYGNGSGYINKVGGTGELIWEKRVGIYNVADGFFDVINVSNNDILACGSVFIADSSVAHGWIVRFDNNGNIKWNHQVGRYPPERHHEYLYNIVALKDGSFVAGGSSAGYDANGNLTQDGWLLRVDSNGCPSSDCNLGINFNKNDSKLSLSVYPNPTTGIINIQSKVAFPNDTKFKIIDNEGRTIMKLQSPSGKMRITYDLSRLSPSVYFLMGTINGSSVFKEKIIIH